ncbi:MAG TPA: hypothetical protein VFQ70_04355 [Candidatus Saccharimonadaceae bacterium]|nr:hypothetical protein [Candidatus Saccharimonadaceae bacterium]
MCLQDIKNAQKVVITVIGLLPEFDKAKAQEVLADESSLQVYANSVFDRRWQLGITEWLNATGGGSRMKCSLLRECITSAARATLEVAELEGVQA